MSHHYYDYCKTCGRLDAFCQCPSSPRDCKHGSLARSCEICELEREVVRLKAELDAAQVSRRDAMSDKHLNPSRVAEILREFDIRECDELKHALEDHARWAKEIVALSLASDELDVVRRELAKLEAQRCETCRFAGEVDDERLVRECHCPALRYLNDHERLGLSTEVPLTVDGEPFGCTAHEPKEETAPKP